METNGNTSGIKPGVRRCLAASLLGGMVFMAATTSLQGSLLNEIIAHYSLTDSAQGLASSLSALGSVTALIISFLLIGKVRKMTLLKIAFAIVTAGLGAMVLQPAFGAFILLWAVIGFGMGLIDTLLSACMSDLYSGKAATRMMCFLHMTFGLSNMATPVLVSRLLAGGLQWHAVYPIIAAFGALLILFTVSATVKAGGGSREAADISPVSFGTMRTALKRGCLPFMVLAMLVIGYYMGGMITWTNRYIGVTLGSSLGDIGLTFLFAGVMFSRFIFPFLNIRPEKYICFGGFAAAAMLLAGILLRSGTVTCVMFTLCGLCFGAMIPCMLNVACESTPENTMLATTPMMLALYIGQILGAPCIGALEASADLHVGIGSCAVMMVLSSVCCILGIRRARRKG